MVGTREYRAWSQMIQRCTNPKRDNYKYYGGRGIKVHPSLRTFEGFIATLGRCPSGMTLDRIDVDGYVTENVRWADKKTQARNTRSNRFLTHRGKTMTMTAWAEEIGLSVNTLWRRLKVGWSVEDALDRPLIDPHESGRVGGILRHAHGA